MAALPYRFARLRGNAGGLRQPGISVVLSESASVVKDFVDGSRPVPSSSLPQGLHLTTVAAEVVDLEYSCDCGYGRAQSHGVHDRQKHSWGTRRQSPW